MYTNDWSFGAPVIASAKVQKKVSLCRANFGEMYTTVHILFGPFQQKMAQKYYIMNPTIFHLDFKVIFETWTHFSSQKRWNCHYAAVLEAQKR